MVEPAAIGNPAVSPIGALASTIGGSGTTSPIEGELTEDRSLAVDKSGPLETDTDGDVADRPAPTGGTDPAAAAGICNADEGMPLRPPTGGTAGVDATEILERSTPDMGSEGVGTTALVPLTIVLGL